MNNEKCPPADQLQAFLLGQLDEDSIGEISIHIDACPPCEETVAALEQQSDTVLAGLRRGQASQFVGDEQYRHALSFVKQIGRDATIAADNVASANDAPPLGNLREYILLEKLGEGGMGAVYKARHSKLDKVVAIKVLPADKLNDAQAIARFEREMRAVGQLEHPNIVRAMDAGHVDGTHFLVMEYVEGVDLSQLVKQHGPLPIADACELIRQAAIGLDEAYERGMVHRDIKPSNLMLAGGAGLGTRGSKKSRRKLSPKSRVSRPQVKILDLGLALISDAQSPEAEALTGSGQLMGTLDYMAPEQGGDTHGVDIRADIYSLGATLHKLLTGQAIYHGEQYARPVQKMMALATLPAPPIQDLRAGIPDALAAIIHRMLEKDPSARFATPDDVADALAPFCNGANLAALTKPQPAVDAPPESNSTTSLLKESAALDTFSQPAIPVDTGCQPVSEPPVTSNDANGKRKPASGTGRLTVPTWVAVGTGLLGIAALLAALVFYFPTLHGTLRVEINDPEIEVKIKDSDIVLTNADKEPIKLKAGEHSLIVTRGDFTFETKRFELKKSETTTVNVELLPGKVQVVSAGSVIGSQAIGLATNPPSAGQSSDGGTNYALEFAGGSKRQYVSVPIDGMKYGKPMTIEGFVHLGELVRLNDKFNLVRGIWQWGQEPGLNLIVSSDHKATQWKVWANKQDGGHISSRRVGEIAPGVHHVALVWTAEGKFQFYLNGVCHGSGPGYDSKFVNPHPELIIGANSDHGSPVDDGIEPSFLGKVDELRISSVARYDKDFQPLAPDHRFTPDQHTLALYHFDEGSGDVLKDSSGNNHHGKIVGAKWVRVKQEPQESANYALDFLGNRSPKRYVSIPLGKFRDKPPLTIEATVYLRPEFTSRQFHWRVWSWWRQPSLEVFQASGTNSEYWFFQGTTTADGRLATCEKVRPGPGPHHVAIVLDADGDSTLFFDGIAYPCNYSIRKVDQEVASGEQLLMLGGNRWGEDIVGNQFDGHLDELRVSKIARYKDNFTPPTANSRFAPDEHTLALYHFDEGSGDVLKDSSGNNHHGKIVGAKWVRVDDKPISDTTSKLPDGETMPDDIGSTTDPLSPAALVASPTKIEGLKAWTLETAGERDVIKAVAFLPDGQRFATFDEHGVVRVRATEDGKLLQVLLGTVDGNQLGYLLEEDRLFTLSDGGDIQRWKLVDGTQSVQRWQGSRKVSGTALSPDGRQLAAWVDDDTAAVFNVASGDEIVTLKAGERQDSEFAWAPDGKRIASGLGIWDATTGEPLHALTINGPAERHPRYATWSPDGKQVITWAGETYLWDADTAKLLGNPAGLTTRLVRWSPDGRYLATGGGFVTSVRDMKHDRHLSGHRGKHHVRAIDWSPDSKQIAIGDEEGNLTLWSRETFESAFTLTGDTETIKEIKIEPTGHYSATDETASHLVYVVETDDGRQITMSPSEFSETYAWRNDETQLNSTQ